MRYVMRSAALVNHQIFERTLHFRDMPGSMLIWVSANPTQPMHILCVLVLDSGIGKDIILICIIFPLLKYRALRDDTPNAIWRPLGNVVVMTALIFARWNVAVVSKWQIVYLYNNTYNKLIKPPIGSQIK